jgi:hypothetical protein
MATIQYTGVVNQIKGSIQGTTFQKCGQSLSIRSNPYHKKTPSINATNSRNEFIQLANTWRAMSPTQQLTFKTFANSYPTVDSWGNPIVLNPWQLFLYINRLLQLDTGVIITSCNPYVAPAISTLSYTNLDVTTGHCYLSIVGNVPANRCIVTYISGIYNPNVAVTSPNYVWAYTLPAGYLSGHDLYTNIIAALKTTPLVNQVIYIKSIQVNLLTGCWALNQVTSLIAY